MFQLSPPNTFEYTLKDYYYPSNVVLTDGEEANCDSVPLKTKKKLKRANNSIEAFFEKPKKKNVITHSSSVGQRMVGGTSYISTNRDEASSATHLIKIQVYDLKKVKDIAPDDLWKSAELRLKYYTQTEQDNHYVNTRDLIYNITKQIATTDDCKKYFYRH